jgi:hypothetical protein
MGASDLSSAEEIPAVAIEAEDPKSKAIKTSKGFVGTNQKAKEDVIIEEEKVVALKKIADHLKATRRGSIIAMRDRARARLEERLAERNKAEDVNETDIVSDSNKSVSEAYISYDSSIDPLTFLKSPSEMRLAAQEDTVANFHGSEYSGSISEDGSENDESHERSDTRSKEDGSEYSGSISEDGSTNDDDNISSHSIQHPDAISREDRFEDLGSNSEDEDNESLNDPAYKEWLQEHLESLNNNPVLDSNLLLEDVETNIESPIREGSRINPSNSLSELRREVVTDYTIDEDGNYRDENGDIISEEEKPDSRTSSGTTSPLRYNSQPTGIL